MGLERDLDRGKGDANGDAGEGAAVRPGRLAWVLCPVASRRTALAFASGPGSPFLPSGFGGDQGRGGDTLLREGGSSQRLCVLSHPAWL